VASARPARPLSLDLYQSRFCWWDGVFFFTFPPPKKSWNIGPCFPAILRDRSPSRESDGGLWTWLQGMANRPTLSPHCLFFLPLFLRFHLKVFFPFSLLFFFSTRAVPRQADTPTPFPPGELQALMALYTSVTLVPS